MAYEGIQQSIGWFPASTAFGTTDQHCLVKFSSSGTIGTDIRITDTSGEFANGVLDDLGAETSGSACRVVVYGVAKVRVSSTHGAIAINNRLFSRDNGTVNNVSSSTFVAVGYALQALAADTSGIISAFISPQLAPSS